MLQFHQKCPGAVLRQQSTTRNNVFLETVDGILKTMNNICDVNSLSWAELKQEVIFSYRGRGRLFEFCHIRYVRTGSPGPS